MPRIVADPDELEVLAKALARAKWEIEVLGVRMSDCRAGLGPQRVRRGVDRLVSNWSDVREKLTAELEAVAGLVGGAASEYRALEQRIASAGAGQRPPAAGAEPAGGR